MSKSKNDTIFEMEFDAVNDRLSSQITTGMNSKMSRGVVQFRTIYGKNDDGKHKVQIRIGSEYMNEMNFVAGDSVEIVYNASNSYVGVRKTEGRGLTLTPYHYGDAETYRNQKGKPVTSAVNFTVNDGDNIPHTRGEVVNADNIIPHAAPDTLAFRLPEDSFYNLSEVE